MAVLYSRHGQRGPGLVKADFGIAGEDIEAVESRGNRDRIWGMLLARV